MDGKLSEQIEAVIDALELLHTLAGHVTQAMRQQRAFFGLLYSFPDDDIAQLIDKLRYIKFLAEQRERAGGIAARSPKPAYWPEGRPITGNPAEILARSAVDLTRAGTQHSGRRAGKWMESS